MNRIVAVVLFSAASLGFAQTAPVAPAPDAAPVTPPVVAPADVPVAPTPGPAPSEVPQPGRITGVETNRDMIAAEAATEIVINGNAGAHCGLTIDFGDGATSGILVAESSPFPLRVAHTYPKTADPQVRVTGTQSGNAPPCLGAVEVTIHVSPAGSKIEYITLSTSCPEGWLLNGEINPDKSFSCAPVADASAPTNLIHCIDGMKYFARGGHIGCMHPAVGIPETPAKVAVVKGKGKAASTGTAGRMAKAGKGMAGGMGMADGKGMAGGMGMADGKGKGMTSGAGAGAAAKGPKAMAKSAKPGTATDKTPPVKPKPAAPTP